MNSLDLSVEEFKAQRRKAQDELVARFRDKVKSGLKAGSYNTLISLFRKVYTEMYREETVQPLKRGALNDLVADVRENLKYATKDSDVEVVSLMLALTVLNGVALHAAKAKPMNLALEWTTMHDSRVRETHVAADGQSRAPGDLFVVGGHKMRFPGDPTAPVDLWINCRCVLRPVRVTQSSAALSYPDDQTEGATMTTTETEKVPEVPVDQAKAPVEDVAGVPWHGVLAPEGIMSGDGRMFADGALRNRDLPLPLTWQKTSAEGHDQNVVVAKIEKMERIDGMMHGSGHFLSIPEADEVVGLIAEFGKFGVSVDADDAQFEFDEDTGQVTFSDARVCSACIVSIPAFAEAFVSLGNHPVLDAETDEEPVVETDEEPVEEVEEEEVEYATTTHSTTITVNGKTVDVTAASHVWDDIEQFKDLAPGITEDGPGWLTHPVDTDRLRDYWVRGPGAAKIGWGAPGDFNRCRLLTAEYVKPQYLSGYCANRHYDALGYWPGQGPHASLSEVLTETDPSEAINIVAAGGFTAPSEWFKNPELTKPTGIIIEESGRTYGHIAEWGVCHIGIGNDCTTAPPSTSGYGYFLTGEVLTDSGPVGVGSLTVATGHADGNFRPRPAASHYDNTGTVWADVTVGEDDFGIWFAGMVRPGTADDTLYAVRASGRLSGDWRKVHGDWEMVGALTVNIPGFPITAPQVTIAAGGQVSLVAAGIVDPPEQKAQIDLPSIAAALADELEARAKRRERAAALRAKNLARSGGGSE